MVVLCWLFGVLESEYRLQMLDYLFRSFEEEFVRVAAGRGKVVWPREKD